MTAKEERKYFLVFITPCSTKKETLLEKGFDMTSISIRDGFASQGYNLSHIPSLRVLAAARI